MIRAYKAADSDKVCMSLLFVTFSQDVFIYFQSGFIELREFQSLINFLDEYNKLVDLFGQLDTNKDKRISFIEFKKGHKLLGQSNIPENHLSEEFNRIDTNHGGYILFDEVCYNPMYI